MTFGAWCDREYGFEYDEVRARGASRTTRCWSPTGRVAAQPEIPARRLAQRRARTYPELGLEPGVPVYELFARDPRRSVGLRPARLAPLWEGFEA